MNIFTTRSLIVIAILSFISLGNLYNASSQLTAREEGRNTNVHKNVNNQHVNNQHKNSAHVNNQQFHNQHNQTFNSFHPNANTAQHGNINVNPGNGNQSGQNPVIVVPDQTPQNIYNQNTPTPQ
jgi:hypothetical protein